MKNDNIDYKLWDYWIHENTTYVVTEENKKNQIPTLKLIWKKNNDSNKKI